MQEEKQILKFPDGFLWGAATSAHQVEGNNHNDWTEWEHANSARLAAEVAKRNANAPMRIPDYILKNYPNPLQRENYISGRACDHYNRFKEDFDIAKSLGHNAHRFSIEWSRIEPEEGKFNEEAIEHYRQVILALRERGIEPFVTLWHWTNPLWIRNIGGWENKKTIEYFFKYAKLLFDEYRDLVKMWTPLNEPGTAVSLGFILGTQPPGKRSLFKANRAFKNLMAAYKKVYVLKISKKYDFKIGTSHYMYYLVPHGKAPWNYAGKKIMDYIMDYRFFNAFKDYSDFFGIQYYRPNFINLKIGGEMGGLFENKYSGRLTSDLGWEIFPEGIYHVVKRAAEYKKPIYITENGLADAKDEKRGNFIKEHLAWLCKAIAQGVDVKGYFHWSLLDNDEFVELRGFWPRFGLVEVDYKTMERKIRPSAYEYAKICKSNSLDI